MSFKMAGKLANSVFLQHRRHDRNNTKHTANSRIFGLGSAYPYSVSFDLYGFFLRKKKPKLVAQGLILSALSTSQERETKI